MIRISFDNSFRQHLPSLLWMIASILPILLLGIAPQNLADLLEFDREQISSGQIWRVYTGNWVHFGLAHTMMNFIGMLAIAALVYWQRHDRYWWLAMALIPVCVGLGLYYDSQLNYYRGFSGAAYGILIIGFILEWRYNRLVMSIAIAILLGKIIQEQIPGYDINYMRDQIGVSVAVKAHFWGVVSGSVCALIILLIQHLSRAGERATHMNGE